MQASLPHGGTVSTGHRLAGSPSTPLFFRINTARKGSSGFKSCSSPPWPGTSQPQPALHTVLPVYQPERTAFTSGSGWAQLQPPTAVGPQASAIFLITLPSAGEPASLDQWLSRDHRTARPVTCGPHHTYRHGLRTASPHLYWAGTPPGSAGRTGGWDVRAGTLWVVECDLWRSWESPRPGTL